MRSRSAAMFSPPTRLPPRDGDDGLAGAPPPLPLADTSQAAAAASRDSLEAPEVGERERERKVSWVPQQHRQKLSTNPRGRRGAHPN